jgi:hypothetical protein
MISDNEFKQIPVRPRCPATGKDQYPDRETAQAELDGVIARRTAGDQLPDQVEQRVFWCPFCWLYHFTSQRRGQPPKKQPRAPRRRGKKRW